LKTIRKVALVTHGETTYVRQLILGAMAYARGATPIATRDFHLEEDVTLDPRSDLARLNQLRNWSPDGLLCAVGAESLERLFQSLPQPRPPIVNLFAAQTRPGLVIVAASHTAWIEQCVRHLRQQGLKSIANLDLDDRSRQEFRRHLFEQIVRPASPATASLFHATKSALLTDASAPVTPVPARLAAWLRQLPKPVGIITATNGGGGYLIRVCQELGLRVPEDIAVMGTDEADLALACTPSLTTVLPDAHAIGTAGMQLLCEWMNGKPAPPEPVRIKGMVLHVRESTGKRRAEICDIPAALAYIERYACQNLSVERLLRETQHVCEKTFYTHFKASTGQTPREAIQRRQLDEARRLLTQTQISITTIAEYCGFADSSCFSRTFRAAEGRSPRDYRKQLKNQNSRGK
jgi:LacI family transcriptional regulator